VLQPTSISKTQDKTKNKVNRQS